ncbi:MAG: fumarylacetoacetate hydrolase family protein [Frankiales bacterium]|jgi:2-keto-4-pentenoate hydratase/2-oxohepta-3-ene-1,7-dioic acid hydratase in catechol pathway|nr:fumarylacetoacetate hydrolase family protein [Frankiales bacterium]
MRFVTFAVATPLGRRERVGALTAAGDAVDLNLAYRASLADTVDPTRAAALADAVLPPDLLQLLAHGSLGRDAVAQALASLPSTAAGSTGSEGEVLVHPAVGLRLLSPVPRPASLRDCSAYEKHIENATKGNIPKRWYEIPAYYKGNPRTVVGTGADVPVPPGCETLDYELEYAAVIGRRGSDLSESTVLDHVAGYLVFNDVSDRRTQFREMSIGLGPAKSKDLDGTNVLGPVLVTPDEWDPHAPHAMRAWVDGEEWSSGSTDTIHHPVERILSHISRAETLHVGDVVGTGTVGFGCGLELGRYPQAGSLVELEVEGLGRLTNRWCA